MSKVQHQARVHPRTVTELSTGAVRAPRRYRRTRSLTPRVEVRGVHPLAWGAALRLAGGDAARIQVVSYTECVVRNRGGRRVAA